MDNECKAWESNVDATFEGNTIGGCAPDNWGACGFQRHFPWRTLTASSAEETALSLTGLASLDIDTTSGFVAAYATSGGQAAIADYNLGGLPFLGGICKLFIPVPSDKIVQVQVAGVHKPGNNYAQFPARATVGATTLDGTAYRFSVANVAESRDNTNGINNGNVAGEGRATAPDGRLDLFAGLNSIQRQAGVAFGVAFGDSLAAQTDVATGGELGEVKAGGNFDVVAHFADDWCEGRWTATDMQMTGDEGAGDVDYNNQQQNAGFSHDHKDIMDKRHNAAGYGTLYATSNTHGAVDNVRWPNSGAWAGFYSFVMCVKTGVTPAGMMANFGTVRLVTPPCPSQPPTTVSMKQPLVAISLPTSASMSVKAVVTSSCAAPDNCPMAMTSVVRGIGTTMPMPVSVAATIKIPRVSSIAQSR